MNATESDPTATASRFEEVSRWLVLADGGALDQARTLAKFWPKTVEEAERMLAEVFELAGGTVPESRHEDAIRALVETRFATDAVRRAVAEWVPPLLDSIDKLKCAAMGTPEDPAYRLKDFARLSEDLSGGSRFHQDGVDYLALAPPERRTTRNPLHRIEPVRVWFNSHPLDAVVIGTSREPCKPWFRLSDIRRLTEQERERRAQEEKKRGDEIREEERKERERKMNDPGSLAYYLTEMQEKIAAMQKGGKG